MGVNIAGLPVSLRVDGTMVVVVLVAGVVLYLYSQRQALAEAVDITSDNNVVNKAATDIVQSVSGGKYENVGDWTYKTKEYNPLAWIFEGVGRITGDIQ